MWGGGPLLAAHADAVKAMTNKASRWVIGTSLGWIAYSIHASHSSAFLAAMAQSYSFRVTSDWHWVRTRR